MNSGTNNDSSSLIEDELLEEMKLIQSNENSSEQPLLSQIEAAMENVRVASERNSPRRKSDMSPRERHNLNASSENYSMLVEKLKAEKEELEREKRRLRQEENMLSFSRRENYDTPVSLSNLAEIQKLHQPKFSSPLVKVSRSPTVERLGEELVKAQQSVEVAEALAGSHQKVILALRAHTDSGDHSKSPEKMKHFKDSVQYVEEELMNEWDGSGDHASAKVTLEYIENLKSAHAKVLGENVELKGYIDDYTTLKQKYARLQEQYKARRKAMLEVKKRQDDAWHFALRALEEKAILQANAHTETIQRLTKQLAKAQELLKSKEFNVYSVTPAGSSGNQSIEALSIKCVELESYVIQIRKENIDLKSENISLKEKLVTATELGQDALRHAEEKDSLLQSHTKTDERKLKWLEHGNKNFKRKLNSCLHKMIY